MSKPLHASVLADLRYFEVSARHLSFTLAARELHITQSAVSQRIRQLEERLGFDLFSRLTRKLVLTAEGQQLARVVITAVAEIEREVERLQSQKMKGEIVMSCIPSLAMQWLVPRLGTFTKQNLDIDLRIKAEFHGLNLATMLSEGTDIAIRYDLGEYTDLEPVLLMDEYLLPVASPQFMAKHPDLKKPDDLAKVTLLHDAVPWEGAESNVEWHHWLKGVDANEVDSGQGFYFNLSHLAARAAITSQGVAMARTTLVAEDIAKGHLVDIFRQPILSPAAYYLVSPKAKAEDPRIQRAVRWLTSECKRFTRERKRIIPLTRDERGPRRSDIPVVQQKAERWKNPWPDKSPQTAVRESTRGEKGRQRRGRAAP